MLKRPLWTLAALVLAVGLTGCGDGNDNADDTADDPSDTSSDTGGAVCVYVEGGEAARDVDLPPDTSTVSGEVSVTIATTAGDLNATLDADATPCTVNSFVSLAEQGFYDETPCPRISDTGLFILQCGDPTGTTGGGPGYTIPDELTGAETYPAGTLAMANTGAPNSGGSQFFVVYEESMLSPDYTVFGTIDQAGIDIVAGIAADGNDGSNPAGGGAPNTPIDITKVSVN
jgi:peptidyl-prolyl cis-trans isomerase B (cyclophilin B)